MPGYLIIDDSNYQDQLGDGEQVEFGGVMRRVGACQKRQAAYGAIQGTTPVADHLDVIPESQWKRLIQEAKERSFRTSAVASRK